MPVKPQTFRPAHLGSVQDSERAYERDRGNFRQRGYTPSWDKLAKLYRVNHPLCLGCEAVGRVEPTTLVDHVVPHRGDPMLMWDEGNLQPSCTPHHAVVKQHLEALLAKGQANKADLKLNSAMAIKTTLELLP